MTKKSLVALSSFTLLFIAIYSFNFFNKPIPQITAENERVKYERFINNHEYSQIRYTQEEISEIPKRDRPDLAWEQNYLTTMNPSLGRPEVEKLFPVLAITKSMQQTIMSAAPGNAGSPWTERGPNNVGGRTRALTWDPTSTNKVWAGSVTGGLWFNNDITNAGSTWQPVNDFWDNIAVTAIAFDPNNNNIIYVGTGEGWGAAASRGAGIWKSTNGGTSFTQISSTTNFYYINDLVIRDEGTTSVIFAAVATKNYEGQFHGSNEGLQRSADGGASWTQKLPSVGAGPEAPTDLEISANNTLFVGVDANVFGQGGGKIYSSADGTTFNAIHDHGSSGRVNLACAPSDANYIYAAFEVGRQLSAFKQSTNGGAAWSARSEPSDVDNDIPNTDFTRGQAWYDLTLDVDPNDRDVLIIGGIDIFKTANGGAAWTQISKWSNNNNLLGLAVSKVHADQHTIVYKPGSSSEIVFGNDGGVFYASNGGNATPTIDSRINGYNVTQYYACAIHPTASTDYFLAGAQDNGTQKYSVAGINSTTEVTGGDGAFCFIDQTNAQFQFSSYVHNSWRRSTNSGGTFSSIQDDQNTGSFINPGDYDDNQDVLYSAHSTSSIQRITSATGTPVIENFTIASLGTMASHLSVSPYTTPTTKLFIGTQGGRVFRVPNAQTGSPAAFEITRNLPTGNISCITFGNDENEILVTLSNYGVTSIWYTSDGAATDWINKEGDLPDMPVRWALFNPNDHNEVILATEVGVWTTTNLNAGSPTWTTSNSGLANVRVDMLQMRTSDNEVIAATHGRGLFSSDGFNGAPFTAQFSADNITPTTAQTVTFTDASTLNPLGWSWSFSPATVTYQGGTNANSQNPQVTFDAAGAYTVTLLANSAADTDSEVKANYINVVAPPGVTPVADFSADVTTLCAAASVSFTDASTNTPTSWSWSFGDGINSTSQNPTHSYTVAGTYTVALTATNSSGSDVETKISYITVSDCQTTQLRALDCGITVSRFKQWLYADPVLNAESYQFLYTNTVTNQQFSKVRPNYVNSLYWANAIEVGATYNVQIRVKIGGIWGAYAASCQVTAPGVTPTTQVSSIDCGTTVSSFSQYIYANPISGAEEYEFVYTNTITNQQHTKTRANYVNSMLWAGITEVNVPYDVKVRLSINGVWGNYGPSCQITSPTSIPTTQLRALDCGTTVSSFGQYIYAIPLSGAESYQFLYTNIATNQQFSKIRPNYLNSLQWANAFEIAATYNVQVRVKIGGTWGPYGASCQVSTPTSIPTTQVRTTDCGITVSSFNQYIYANRIAGAEEYEFVYTNIISNQQHTKTRVNYVNSMLWAGITDISATYDVKVRLKFNGVWGSYGPICQITSPASAIIINSDYQEMISQKQHASNPIILTAYPNPNNGFGIFLDIVNPDYNNDNQVEITLLDLYGKLVYREIFQSESNHQVKHISFYDQLASGIYLLSIKNGGSLTTYKIIVN